MLSVMSVDLNIAAKILLDLEAEHGAVYPADVVETARPEDSPLHDYFEWNDTVAGEKYRLVEAGRLIRRIEVRHIKPEITEPTVRKIKIFHNTQPTGTGSLYASLKVLHDDELRAERARRVLRARLTALRNEYEWLTDLPQLVEDVFFPNQAA